MKKIMIVDDEPDQIFTLECFLKCKSNEFEVISACSGKECLEKLKDKKELPDLILLDIMMSDMNGFEVFDNIKSDSRFSFIPVVFLSACDDKFDKDIGEFLADDYIMKPFEQDDIIKRINKILDKN